MTHNEPPDHNRQTVTTEQAARALHLQPAVFKHWADRGLVTPVATDPDGTRWWNLHDLRRELARYLTDDQD
jgi:DNA-binding transcriptional MerR regulator